ncbi:MAG: UDP-3-O-(3-hydroxymyristoyl)glucosamine N-acyltransferase [Robiginitomaculum sp.]
MVNSRFYNHLGPFSLLELLDSLDVTIPEGQFSDITVKHATPVNSAGRADICYIETEKQAKKLKNFMAGLCFVKAENAHYVGAQNCLAIHSKFPRADFAKILTKLYKPKGYDTISSHSDFKGVTCASGVVIGAGAIIGQGTSIGPNTVIGPGVKIGKNCTIGANNVIEFVDIGDNCKILNTVVIGASGFGIALSENGGVDVLHIGQVIIENNVTIGSLSAIDKAMFGATHIGEGCKFDNYVHIAHNVKVGAHSMLAAQVGIAGSTVIGKGVIMGGKAGVADHLHLGDGCTLAANSSTMHDIPAGEVWSGYPAQPIRQHMRQVAKLRKLGQSKKK